MEIDEVVTYMYRSREITQVNIPDIFFNARFSDFFFCQI